MNNLYAKIFAVFVLIVIAGAAVLHFMTPDRAYSAAEKRNLDQAPELSPENVAAGVFMDRAEGYLQDQFPFRDQLMQTKITVQSTLLRNRESQGVYLADGMLVERFTMPPEEETAALLASLEAFAARNPGPSYSFMLVPNAVAFYRDRLPAYALTDSQDEYIDRFFFSLPEPFEAKDVRQLFKAVKNDVLLYYRTDHHWTTEAACIAFTGQTEDLAHVTVSGRGYSAYTVADRFYGSLQSKSGFTGLGPDAIRIYLPDRDAEPLFYSVYYPDTQSLESSVYDTDKLATDDPYQVFLSGNHPLVEIETSARTGKRILVIKDSYANAYVPFLVPGYDRVTVLDPRYYYEDIDALVKSGRFTEVLFLYNVNTLSADTSLKTVLDNRQ